MPRLADELRTITGEITQKRARVVKRKRDRQEKSDIEESKNALSAAIEEITRKTHSIAHTGKNFVMFDVLPPPGSGVRYRFEDSIGEYTHFDEYTTAFGFEESGRWHLVYLLYEHFSSEGFIVRVYEYTNSFNRSCFVLDGYGIKLVW